MVTKDEELKKVENAEEGGNQEDKVFSPEEIKIEEVTIDVICGVY